MTCDKCRYYVRSRKDWGFCSHPGYRAKIVAVRADATCEDWEEAEKQ